MNRQDLINQKKGISPIIATLLLILIAIAAGVIVYAYVIGFIGASTSNSGGTTNTLSIDQVTFSSKASNFPVTVYVRNEGPTSESFNTGFFAKNSSSNNVLVGAVELMNSSATPPTITKVSLLYSSATFINVTVTLQSVCATGQHVLEIVGFGNTTALTSAFYLSCKSTNLNQATVNLEIPSTSGLTVSSDFNATVSSLTVALTQNVYKVIGVSLIAGTYQLSVNSVATFTLAGAASGSSGNTEIVTKGITYTVQVTGTDGASTTASAKAS